MDLSPEAASAFSSSFGSQQGRGTLQLKARCARPGFSGAHISASLHATAKVQNQPGRDSYPIEEERKPAEVARSCGFSSETWPFIRILGSFSLRLRSAAHASCSHILRICSVGTSGGAAPHGDGGGRLGDPAPALWYACARRRTRARVRCEDPRGPEEELPL